MAKEDKEVQRLVQREFAKRPLDISRMTVYSSRGVVYLNGQISVMRGHDINLQDELDAVMKTLRQRPGVRDVISNLVLR